MVTAADLRVAQGYVRCGRCSSVFNALARLSDERQAAVPGGGPAPAPAPDPESAEQESVDPETLSSDSPVHEERADLSPLDEALNRTQETETPELPETAEEPVSDDALEFDPKTTDVGSVFVQAPPNPQWTAATGSFKAMRAANREPNREEPAPPADGDAQLDVEIDAAFLAEMLREPASADSARPPSEPSPPEPPAAEPPAAEPRPAAAPPQQRAAAAPTAPPSAPPPARAPAENTRGRLKAAAGAVTGSATLAGASPRPAVRHAAPHTRPPAAARTHGRSAPVPQPEPPAPEVQALDATDEPASAMLDLDADEPMPPQGGTGRFRIWRDEPQVWAAAAVLALLLLAAQIVNHYRDELAATPRFGRPLTSFYASLGVQLVPHWDLRAYDVRQLGAAADPAGSGLITVRASIKNAGHQSQPLPLLRVTLQDRFGNRIAARDVAPRFYVPPSVPESSYLAGGQRIDAEMGFVDPGVNAVGFEIDACLPASGGGITCANDLAAR
jgi:hypothetical protein